jgi:hypothetical protein
MFQQKLECICGCMYVWGVGHNIRPLHRDFQWSIMLYESVDSSETLPFKFHENLFRGSRVITCGRTGMEKLIGASLRLPPPLKRDKENLWMCTLISVPNSHIQECCFLFALTGSINYITTQHFLKIHSSSVFGSKYRLVMTLSDKHIATCLEHFDLHSIISFRQCVKNINHAVFLLWIVLSAINQRVMWGVHFKSRKLFEAVL